MERPVFLREQANNMYNFIPYFLAKSVIEFPLSLICPVITLLIVYWGAGFRSDGGEEFL